MRDPLRTGRRGGVVSIWMGPAVWVVHGLTFTGTLVLSYSAAQVIRESLISLEVIREHFESLEL